VNILNVNHLLDAKIGGGTAERTLQLSRSFEKAGVRCTVLTLDVGITEKLLQALHGASLIPVRYLNLRYFVPRVSFKLLRKLISEATFVQLSGHWTVLNALVFLMCRQQNKPYLFCPAGALTPMGRSVFLKKIYDAVIGFRIARNAAMCIAITDHERADFSRYGVSDEHVRIIANGIDPQEYVADPAADAADAAAVRVRYGIGDAPYILFLGRLNSIKGPDLLLDAFARIADKHPGLLLVFAGPDGGMLGIMQQKMTAHGLSGRVLFTGYIGGSDKVALLRSATLLAIPSRREAMSIVVLEAGICATPALFTNACGLEEFATAGAGTMVAPSADGLAEGLSSMLADPEASKAAARKLKHIVLDRYTWDKQAALYLNLLDTLATKDGR
jgi:glycosyltransferase involved in cell wall biosynthesis